MTWYSRLAPPKYGVRDEQGQLSDDRLRAVASHDEVRMMEIKLSQGAKPGKGGILPGAKVTEVIASTRSGIPWARTPSAPTGTRIFTVSTICST